MNQPKSAVAPQADAAARQIPGPGRRQRPER